jgi:protein TonB
VQTVLPQYTEQVNAVIRVRITVAPSGRVTRRIPLIKGNPGLEQAVMNALLNWRFNPLPPNAPQEEQTGVVTFRFQLR